jgi:hypothetical protein
MKTTMSHGLHKQPKQLKQLKQSEEQQQEPEAQPTAEGTASEHALVTDDLGTVSLSDLMEYEMPPQRWAIEDLVPTGLTILAGRPKFGKSWFAFDACLAVATGGTLLGKPAIQGTALYLALEDTPRRLQDRAKTLLDGQAAPAGLRVRTEWSRLDLDGLADLEAFLDAYLDTRLVVIDVIKKVAPPHNTNRSQYAYDYELVSKLKRLADSRNLAIVLVTHTTKFSDDDDPFVEIAGSTGTTGAMDTGLVMRQHRQGKYKELCIRGRDVSEDRFPIRFDEHTCRWQLASEEGDPFVALGLTPEQHDVASLLWMSDAPMAPKDVAEMLEGMSASAATKHLLHLANQGIAERCGYGRYHLSADYRGEDGEGEMATQSPSPTARLALPSLPRRGGRRASMAAHAA